MRTLASLVALLLLVGCAGRAPRAVSRAAVLGRPGDATRVSVLALGRGEPLPVASADPLPTLGCAELRAQPLEAPGGAFGAGAFAPRAPYRAPLFGPWRLSGDGAVMPLQGAWRMRVGLSAGGAPPESALPEAGRSTPRYLVPGVRVERDL